MESSLKYALMINMSKDPNDWLFVTEDTGSCMDLLPKTYDDRILAEHAAGVWQAMHQTPCKVVEYLNE